jgi:hypothetical protein
MAFKQKRSVMVSAGFCINRMRGDLSKKISTFNSNTHERGIRFYV